VILLGVAADQRSRLFMSEPNFECCVWQRGAKWHWQCMNDLEQVLASGIAENKLAARIAAVLHCFQRLGNHSRPH
jgi:hypothetical protein